MKKKLPIILCLLLLGVLVACRTAESEIVVPPVSGETSVPEVVTPPTPPEALVPEIAAPLAPQETPTPEESPPVEIETPADGLAAIDIPIYRPFEPISGNVIMLSHTFFETLIFTDCSIWKVAPDDIWLFSESEPVRMMDTVPNIVRSIENTHILTTDSTLYFLDFDNGQAVKQLENVTSFHHYHGGNFYTPLHYVRTADGVAWRVDQAQPIRLPDDYIVVMYDWPMPDEIPDNVLNQWFDYVRVQLSWWVLTECNVLWTFDQWWEDDAVPSMFAEDIQTLYGGFVITTDNVLWRLPAWGETDLIKVMENVQSISWSLIITTDNELWGYHRGEGEEPFKIMENVQSVQPPSGGFPFGFITTDNTLWQLPDWRRPNQAFQEPILIKENVLRTWWLNMAGSQYIITTDGSLWLFNPEDIYFVQIFQAVAE